MACDCRQNLIQTKYLWNRVRLNTNKFANLFGEFFFSHSIFTQNQVVRCCFFSSGFARHEKTQMQQSKHTTFRQGKIQHLRLHGIYY